MSHKTIEFQPSDNNTFLNIKVFLSEFVVGEIIAKSPYEQSRVSSACFERIANRMCVFNSVEFGRPTFPAASFSTKILRFGTQLQPMVTILF